MLFRGRASILLCLISAIIGHGKDNAGEVDFGVFSALEEGDYRRGVEVSVGEEPL